jgi:histidine triad (HIT) family protein
MLHHSDPAGILHIPAGGQRLFGVPQLRDDLPGTLIGSRTKSWGYSRACKTVKNCHDSQRMAEKSLFEKICAKEIPATILHEDERCVAFRDISPQAPVHVLVVPRKPVVRIGLADPEDEALLGHLLLTAAAVARSEGLSDSGYRLIINNGRDGGEAVPHLHIHLLGGRKLEWPPG